MIIIDDPKLNEQPWCPWCGEDTPGGFCDGQCQCDYIEDIIIDEMAERIFGTDMTKRI